MFYIYFNTLSVLDQIKLRYMWVVVAAAVAGQADCLFRRKLWSSVTRKTFIKDQCSAVLNCVYRVAGQSWHFV